MGIASLQGGGRVCEHCSKMLHLFSLLARAYVTAGGGPSLKICVGILLAVQRIGGAGFFEVV